MTKSRRLRLEALEKRMLLAATADIVFVFDESGSQAASYSAGPNDPPEGDVLRPWVKELIPRLDDKLENRGITGNRYGLITFGDNDNDNDPSSDGTELARSHFITGNNVFGTASQIESYVDDDLNFYDAGGQEDALAGLAVGVGMDGLNITGQYTFRADAAVQFLVVADEFRHFPPGENIGDEDGNGGSLFTAILDQLRLDNITTDGEDLLQDAVVTSVAPFDYSETDILATSGSADEPIFGIDVHLLDSVNLDGEQDGQVIAGSPQDEFVVFKWNGTDGVEAELKVGDASDPTNYPDMNLMDDDYQSVWGAFDDPCTEVILTNCPIEDDPDDEHWEAFFDVFVQFINQENFDAEDYAFLTWEARGTAWDFEVLRANYNTVANKFTCGGQTCQGEEAFDDSNGINTQIEFFTAAVVDDVFEKIRLQIADFNGDGTITLAGEITAFWEAAKAELDNPSSTDERLYDLDGDGVLIAAGAIDPDDIDILLEVFLTVPGDVDFDYDFDSGDLVVVYQAGEYDDSTNDNSVWSEGDWNGDFDFTSGDNVVAFQFGAYNEGVIDEDGDGIADYLPIWALDEALNGTEDFYRPDWF